MTACDPKQILRLHANRGFMIDLPMPAHFFWRSMKEQSRLNYKIISVIAFLLGCMGLIGIMLVDVLYLHVGFLQEGLPKLSYGWLLRSAAIFFFLVVITFSITGGRRYRGVVLLTTPSPSLERLSVLGTLLISSLFLLVFLIQPAVFSSMSQENYPIEAASAILLLCSCATSTLAAVRARAQASVPMVTTVALATLALVFFVIAMEEISWGQQIFDLKTPDAFSGNEQRELNFHNFATNRVENVYYFGAFLFLVVLPFLGVLFPASASQKVVGPLFPRPFTIPLGAIICAYNFDMWNILFIQVSFFSSLIVLSLLSMLSADKNEWIIVVLTLILLIATQVTFLTNGDNFDRIWEVTEYKEFLISLAFLAYSVSVYRNLPRPVVRSDARHS